MPLGTGVTALVHRYHPAIVAQFVATLELMFPGRAFIGLGSGESMNETPIGMAWPEPDEQLERLEDRRAEGRDAPVLARAALA